MESWAFPLVVNDVEYLAAFTASWPVCHVVVVDKARPERTRVGMAVCHEIDRWDPKCVGYRLAAQRACADIGPEERELYSKLRQIISRFIPANSTQRNMPDERKTPIKSKTALAMLRALNPYQQMIPARDLVIQARDLAFPFGMGALVSGRQDA